MEVKRPSIKQLLNNFLGQFFRKTYTIFGARIKKGLFIKKRCRYDNRIVRWL